MTNKNLIIIDNEKIYNENNNFYCDNIDSKSIPEGLNNIINTHVVARKSDIKRVQKINLENIKTGSNIIEFLYLIIKTFKIKNVNYLIISINPYTFFSSIILLLFRKKIFIYLRSSGHEEYHAKYGVLGKFIYHIMFFFITSKVNLIVCHERLALKKKHHLVFPSQLDEKWFKNFTQAPLDKIRLLYVGRMRIEKGIFDFMKMFNQINLDIELSIVGDFKKTVDIGKNINLHGYGYDTASLIKLYDSHNIFILPSFTEGHPQVVLESLARKRPVIIFDSIKHIIGQKKGIFVSSRNIESFSEKIKFIIKNYQSIQEDIEKNDLPTKNSFIEKMSNILKQG